MDLISEVVVSVYCRRRCLVFEPGEEYQILWVIRQSVERYGQVGEYGWISHFKKRRVANSEKRWWRSIGRNEIIQERVIHPFGNLVAENIDVCETPTSTENVVVVIASNDYGLNAVATAYRRSCDSRMETQESFGRRTLSDSPSEKYR